MVSDNVQILLSLLCYDDRSVLFFPAHTWLVTYLGHRYNLSGACICGQRNHEPSFFWKNMFVKQNHTSHCFISLPGIFEAIFIKDFYHLGTCSAGISDFTVLKCMSEIFFLWARMHIKFFIGLLTDQWGKEINKRKSGTDTCELTFLLACWGVIDS